MLTRVTALLLCLLTPTLAALPDHPRLLLPDADLPAVQARIAHNPFAANYLRSLQAKYAPELNKPIQLPDRGGQWFHYYACPIHGTRLRTQSPTQHVCPVDGQVFTGYPYDDCAITFVHLALAESVRDLGLLYRITGDAKYATRARDIALAYADKYLSYAYHDIHGQPKVPGGRVTPQTLDEAIWLINLARGVDQIWPTLTPDQITSLKTKLFYPCVTGVILPQTNLRIHNIQCWKDSAVGLTALLFDDPELLKNAVDSPHGLRAELKEGVTPDGQWDEGAWGYHFYALSAMLPLTEALRTCGLADFYTPDSPLHRMFSFPLAIAMPDGHLPAFNDSDSVLTTGIPEYELGLARFHDPLLATPIQPSRTYHRENLPALLYGVTPLPDPPKETPPSQNFPASGYAVLRSPHTWLCLKYGPHGGGHGHYDKLTFVLYANNQILSDDPGNSPYGLPLHNAWHKTTLAHNTLSVDQQNQHESTGSCLAFLTGKGYSATLLDAGPVYPHATLRRAAFLLNDSLLVFLDSVTTTDHQDHTIDLAYHPAGSWTAPSGWTPTSRPTTQPTQSPAYAYLQDLSTLTTSDPLTLPIGSTTITFSNSTPTTYLVGTSVGKNTSIHTPLLLARRTAQNATFAWALTTEPNAPAPTLTQESPTLRVQQAGQTWLLRTAPKLEVLTP